MTAFAEVRLDDNLIIYRTVGGSLFSTSVVVVESGDETRNSNWALPLGAWDLGERDMVPADFEAFNDFFNARNGKAQGFRFRNWADYKDKGHGVLLPITGSATTVQMFKTYASGGTTAMRKITKPTDSIDIYRNGVLIAATVDLTTGIVTPATMGGVLTWTGEFDTPVRFDTDQVQHEFIAANVGMGGTENVSETYFHLHALPIVEIRIR